MVFSWDGIDPRPRFTPNQKIYLYKKYKGICQGCGKKKDIEDTDIDHIKPFSRYPELGWRESNLQVLCRNCNTTKGDGTMAYLRRRLAERGVAVKQPKSATNSKPQSTAQAKPRQVANAKPKAVAKAKPKATVKTKPKAVANAKPRAVAKAKPKAAVKTRPKAVANAKPRATRKG